MKKALVLGLLIATQPLWAEEGSVDFRGASINNSDVTIQAPQPYVETYKPSWSDSTYIRHYEERGLKLGGPRFGLTYISGAGFEKLQEAVNKAKPNTPIEPYMSHFGWQLEYRIVKTQQGLTALTEFVPVVYGMDQGVAIPALNWLIGVRGANGFELGVGPNIGVNGVSLMVGTGFTFDMGGINVPMNLVVGRTNQTTALSISTGFNL